jgi:hypothetical protein
MLAALLHLTGPPPAGAEDDAMLDRCSDWMAEVSETLATEPPLRDEAYTAIMWARLDAERARAEGDGDACLVALDLPRRALGLHTDSASEPHD